MTKEGTAPAPYPANPAIVDLNNLLQKVLQSRESVHNTSKIGLQLELAGNLPHAWANAKQMERVLLKLIVNAEEALGDDLGRPGQIQVKTAVERGRIHVLVIDNGRGIHSREMARLFENQETSIELTACSEIVRDHGGELYAWSSYGKGSVFTLELPIHVGMEQDVQLAPPPTQQGLFGKRILVVDDEVHISRLMSDVLETQGAEIDLANSGMQAVEQIKAKEYDLFICDQHMPGFSGERLYWSVKSVNPELRQRFLFVTGDVLNDDTTHFFMRTGVRYIRKPFRSVELVTAVEQALNRSQQLSS